MTPPDVSHKHLQKVREAASRLVQEIDLCLEKADDAQKHAVASSSKDKPDLAGLAHIENQISDALGRIHTLAENAMNDYRVNRKVARVDASWRHYITKRVEEAEDA